MIFPADRSFSHNRTIPAAAAPQSAGGGCRFLRPGAPGWRRGRGGQLPLRNCPDTHTTRYRDAACRAGMENGCGSPAPSVCVLAENGDECYHNAWILSSGAHAIFCQNDDTARPGWICQERFLTPYTAKSPIWLHGPTCSKHDKKCRRNAEKTLDNGPWTSYTVLVSQQWNRAP